MAKQVIIKIHGHLDKSWQNWFEGMNISYSSAQTIFQGEISDDTNFYGILNKFRDLNLKLISVDLKPNNK